MSIESENKFLAVHSEFATYTVFSNLDKCKEMRIFWHPCSNIHVLMKNHGRRNFFLGKLLLDLETVKDNQRM